MKRFIFFLFFWFWMPDLQAQKVILSPEVQSNHAGEELKVIGMFDGRVYCYAYTGKDYLLFALNEEMQFQHIDTLTFLSHEDEKHDFLILDNGIHCFYQKRNGKLLTLESRLITGEGISDVKSVDSVYLSSRRQGDVFNVVSGENNASFLAYIGYRDVERRKVNVRFKAFNSGYISFNAFSEPFESNEDFEIIRAGLSTSGTIVAIVGEKTYNTRIHDHIIILEKSRESENLNSRLIPSTEYAYSGLKICFDKKMGFMYLGALVHKNKFREVMGTAVWVYDFNRDTILSENLTPFALSGRMDRNLLQQMVLKSFVVTNDGGFEFEAEKSFVETRTSNVNRNFISNGMSINNIPPAVGQFEEKEFYDEDILIVHVNPDYSIRWTQLVHKQQASMESNIHYASYGTLVHPYGHAYVFNDFGNGRQNRTVIAYLSSKGDLTMKTFDPDEERDNQKSLLYRKAVQIRNSALIVPVYYNGFFSFAQIIF